MPCSRNHECYVAEIVNNNVAEPMNAVWQIS